MNFEIKLYRAPKPNNDVIVIGRAQTDIKGLKRVLPAADELLYRMLTDCLEELSHAGPRTALLAAVRTTIAEALRDGKPNLVRVANELEVGPRTLQRRLKNYHIDFKRLVNDTRCSLALTYLQDTQNTLTEIAFLLGYSEVSAFNRAFKRWTGSTPLEYRRVIARPKKS
jgi:AraC-like DNA-binding protein